MLIEVLNVTPDGVRMRSAEWEVTVPARDGKLISGLTVCHVGPMRPVTANETKNFFERARVALKGIQ